jgi:Domain of unknown function (DUF4180)
VTEFLTTEAGGIRVVEGTPGAAMLLRGQDVSELVEACINGRARAVLLHAENLPPDFFDLSSGAAGEVLQKLRSYGGIRLAVVVAAGAVRPSTRFNDMAVEERRKGYFAMFENEAAARAWLAEASS